MEGSKVCPDAQEERDPGGICRGGGLLLPSRWSATSLRISGPWRIPLQAGIPLNRIMKAEGIPETVVQKINGAARKMAWGKEGDDCVFAAMQQAGTIVPESAHLVRDIVATLERLIAKKDRATLNEFVYDVMRDATGLYQRALAEENGQDLIFLNTFSRIVAEYESITKESTLADLLGYLDLLSGYPWKWANARTRTRSGS